MEWINLEARLESVMESLNRMKERVHYHAFIVCKTEKEGAM